MKISSLLSFKGVEPEHSENGYFIKPIYKNYTSAELQCMVDSINQDKFLGSGKNGEAYALDKKVVIKRTKADPRVKDSVMTEAEKLDRFYQINTETYLDLQNSQKGLAAFKTPEGRTYLISTRVPGEHAIYGKNPLNKKNLSSIMRIITTLDKGIKDTLRIMPYDFNGNNINFTKRKAGLLDFEYMELENIETFLTLLKKVPDFCNISPHISDTSPLNSSLRSFEQNFFLDYLTKMPEDEAKIFFRQYLHKKSEYHKKMSKHFTKLAKKYPDMKQEYLKLSEKEKNHSNILAKKVIDADIVKAEAMKIQLAYFVFKLYDALCNNIGKLPFIQTEKYFKDTLKHIQESLRKAICSKDISKARYYFDCKMVMNMWRLIPRLSHNVKNANKTKTFIKRTLEQIVK